MIAKSSSDWRAVMGLRVAAAPAANYVPWRRVGDQIIVAGQLPMRDGKVAVTGRLGDGISLEQGQEAARLCALNILAQVKAACERRAARRAALPAPRRLRRLHAGLRRPSQGGERRLRPDGGGDGRCRPARALRGRRRQPALRRCRRDRRPLRDRGLRSATADGAAPPQRGIGGIDADAWDGAAARQQSVRRPRVPVRAMEDERLGQPPKPAGSRCTSSSAISGRPSAAAPLYAKSHSYGEYVFDHGWADAYRRAGGRYYPKLQVAVPFTPVPGPRLLGPAEHRGALAQALVEHHPPFRACRRCTSPSVRKPRPRRWSAPAACVAAASSTTGPIAATARSTTSSTRCAAPSAR